MSHRPEPSSPSLSYSWRRMGSDGWRMDRFLLTQKIGTGIWLWNARQEQNRNMGKILFPAEIPTTWLNSHFDFVWSLGVVLSHFSSPRKKQRYPHDKTGLASLWRQTAFSRKGAFYCLFFSISVADTGEVELSSSPNPCLLDSNRQRFFLRLWKSLMQHNSWLHN